jgi:hypothetical protein
VLKKHQKRCQKLHISGGHYLEKVVDFCSHMYVVASVLFTNHADKKNCLRAAAVVLKKTPREVSIRLAIRVCNVSGDYTGKREETCLSKVLKATRKW